MYTGEETLDSIALFLFGYRYAIWNHEIAPGDDPFFIPDDFNEWVGYRLRLAPGSMDYPSLIRLRTNSEKEAIDKFFGLLHEYRTRKAHVVTRFVDRGQNFSIVTYTDDPGFFLLSDKTDEEPRVGSFFRDWKWLEQWYGIARDRLSIVDPARNLIENQPDDDDETGIDRTNVNPSTHR